MAKLFQPASSPEVAVALIGGAPTVGAGHPWPVCTECDGHMQFLAQVPLAITGIPEFVDSDRILLAFLCENDPGMCLCNGGGDNKAIITGPGDKMPVPETGEVRAPRHTPAIAVDYDDSVRGEYDSDVNYWDACVAGTPEIFGKVGGKPIWVQADETPTCPCGSKMAFAIQINEAGGDFNFAGDGDGYVFACPACREQARFLWQCG